MKYQILSDVTFQIKAIADVAIYGIYPGSQKSLSRKKKKRLEVTSPAIVVLNAFLDSSDLPKGNCFGVML